MSAFGARLPPSFRWRSTSPFALTDQSADGKYESAALATSRSR
jgi:hypothetical protein